MGVCVGFLAYYPLLDLLIQTLVVIDKKLKCGIHDLHRVLLQSRGCGQEGRGAGKLTIPSSMPLTRSGRGD